MKANKYRVRWSTAASGDLEAIIGYIALEGHAIALTQLKRVTRAADRLEKFPERGRVVPELREQGISIYREVIIAPWRLIFRISKQKVYVLALIDSRRNLEDLLLERFTR